MTRAVLAVDIGTGSARAAIVTDQGKVACIASVPMQSFSPRHGWTEQRPEDWWSAVCSAISSLLNNPDCDASAIACVVCCGHMHAATPVGLDLTAIREYVPLWNDKRTTGNVSRHLLSPDAHRLRNTAANPATPAWPAFKLCWMRDNDPVGFAKTFKFLMPKDYINARLTSVCAMDRTEAGSSFLFDAEDNRWSPDLFAHFGIDPEIAPPILLSSNILGRVSAAAAAATNLPQGLPVVVGAGDYPAALLGSGVVRAGQISDITGTSFLLTALGSKPVQAEAIMNVATVQDGWGAFAVVDAAGDSVRWARGILSDSEESYDEVYEKVSNISAGSDSLLYLPYLTGERLGPGADLRGGFFGLSLGHQAGHLHRAVLEGVAMAMRVNAQPLFERGMVPDRIIAAGGGARARLWLEIKSAVFERSYLPTVEPEAGLIGAAALGFAALDNERNVGSVAETLVKFGPEVEPKPQAVEEYKGVFAGFERLREAMIRLQAGSKTN